MKLLLVRISVFQTIDVLSGKIQVWINKEDASLGHAGYLIHIFIVTVLLFIFLVSVSQEDLSIFMGEIQAMFVFHPTIFSLQNKDVKEAVLTR